MKTFTFCDLSKEIQDQVVDHFYRESLIPADIDGHNISSECIVDDFKSEMESIGFKLKDWSADVSFLQGDHWQVEGYFTDLTKLAKLIDQLVDEQYREDLKNNLDDFFQLDVSFDATVSHCVSRSNHEINAYYFSDDEDGELYDQAILQYEIFIKLLEEHILGIINKYFELAVKDFEYYFQSKEFVRDHLENDQDTLFSETGEILESSFC